MKVVPNDNFKFGGERVKVRLLKAQTVSILEFTTPLKVHGFLNV